MLNKKSKISNIIIVVLLLTILLMGCAPARRPINERDRIDINQQRVNENNLNVENIRPQEDRLPEGALGYDNIPHNINKDLNLERELELNPDIRDVVIILDNNTAYVGLEAEDRNDVNNMRGLQAMVAGRIREYMPGIERVYITSDRDRVERLREYRQRVTSGTPAGDMITEIERLFS